MKNITKTIVLGFLLIAGAAASLPADQCHTEWQEKLVCGKDAQGNPECHTERVPKTVCVPDPPPPPSTACGGLPTSACR